MSDTSVRKIPERLGSYEIVQHLASGGMAEIYLAEQLGPHGFRKRVVVKRIKSDHSGDPNFETMFLDEARLSAQLSHPHIVQTHELDHCGESWFVAMEYVDGPSFEELLLRADLAGKVVDPAVVLRIVSDVLAALAYAHDFVDHEGNHLEIVHRDVTPSNVLVSTAGVAKLADFGIAKAVGRQTETQTGAVKGKFGYMAPEQVEGSDVDGRTDLFAVGIMLYEALAGAKPFGEGLKAVHGVLQDDPDPLATRNENLPESLCSLVDRCLRKDPDQRYPTAAAMLSDLETVAREHQLQGTATDVVAKLGLSINTVALDPHGDTVAAVAPAQPAMTVAVAAAPDEPSHRGLPIAIVAIAILFIGLAVGLASLASSGSAAKRQTPATNRALAPTPTEVREEQRRRIEQMKPSNTRPEEQNKLDEAQRELEKRRRESVAKAREKAQKRSEKAQKKREKERGKERNKDRGKR